MLAGLALCVRGTEAAAAAERLGTPATDATVEAGWIANSRPFMASLFRRLLVAVDDAEGDAFEDEDDLGEDDSSEFDQLDSGDLCCSSCLCRAALMMSRKIMYGCASASAHVRRKICCLSGETCAEQLTTTASHPGGS